MIIYVATNKTNGKQYVGQTVSSLKVRKRSHRHEAKKNKNNGMYITKAIRKYGMDGFDWTILHDNITNIDDLNKLEMFYIGYYNTFEDGYNLTKGGEGAVGCSPSKETRQLISIANTGKTRTREHRENLSKALKGKKRTEGTKRLLSKINTGKKLSAEHKENIRKGMLGKNRGKLSREHRQKLSDAHRGVKLSAEHRQNMGKKTKGKNNPNARAVIINNKYFDTLTEAGKFFNINRATIGYRLKKQISGYRYANK